ncbi:MAG: FAD-dependent monooxygenase [Methylovirgula sp.]
MEPRILIVGAGPVGLIVATELARYGIAHDIIEANVSKNSYSKALSVSAASLKAFRGLGIADEFLRAGKAIYDIEVYFQGKRCARINNEHLPSCFNFYVSMPQPETEAIIERRLLSLGGAVRYGYRLAELSQNEHGVDVRLVHEATGDSSSARYDYVIGCDGVQSATRKLLDISYLDHEYNAHFIMGDVTFGAPREATTSYHVFDDGFLIYLPMSRGLTRLVVGRHHPLAEGQQNPTQEELQVFLDRYYPEKLKIEKLVWASRTRFFNRLAETNAVGKVFLAGDSFHLFSPIGGQGMNTGVQDAMNLSWKIALTVKGLAKPPLLESYRLERYAAVKKVLKSTHENTLRILRRVKDYSFVENYHVCFRNRNAYRVLLPAEFSGFASDHALEQNSPVGRHAPYLAIEGDATTPTTYDIPHRLRSVVIVRRASDMSKIEKIAEQFERVLSVATLKDEQPMAQNQSILDDAEICLIRPDGYIGYHGQANGISAYLGQYYVSA